MAHLFRKKRVLSARCWAIVANNRGTGCVLLYGGGDSLRLQIEEYGCVRLEDLGLDDAPDGLSVWEGHYVTAGGDALSGVHDDNVETRPVGRFRTLGQEDWHLLQQHNHERVTYCVSVDLLSRGECEVVDA